MHTYIHTNNRNHKSTTSESGNSSQTRLFRPQCSIQHLEDSGYSIHTTGCDQHLILIIRSIILLNFSDHGLNSNDQMSYLKQKGAKCQLLSFRTLHSSEFYHFLSSFLPCFFHFSSLFHSFRVVSHWEDLVLYNFTSGEGLTLAHSFLAPIFVLALTLAPTHGSGIYLMLH